MGWLGFAWHRGTVDLEDLQHFKWLQAGECDLVDDHMLSGYFHFRQIQVLGPLVPKPEETILTSQPGLSDLEPLTHLLDVESSRPVASIRCRARIWATTRTDFPYWCCWGCCQGEVLKAYARIKQEVDQPERWLQVRRFCAERFADHLQNFAHCLAHYLAEAPSS